MSSRLSIQHHELSVSWPDVMPVAWNPHDYQKAAVKLLVSQPCAGLLLDPGAGKTAMALAAFKILKKKGLVTRMLLVCPLRPAHMVWPKELYKWSDFHDLTFRVLHGPKKDALLRAEEQDPSDVVIVNVDGLKWLLGATAIRGASGRPKVSVDLGRARSFGFDVLCVDELSKFKHTQSQRFKMVKPVLSSFARRWGLTGSPAANGLEGLFGETYMLDEGRTFGPYVTHFRTKYFVPAHNGFGWEPQHDAEERIFAAVKPLMLRMELKGHVKEPEIVVNNVEVALPTKARKVYDDLEKEMITLLGDGEDAVVAASKGVLVGKLRQVANGGLYYEREGKRLDEELHMEKAEAVRDLVEELQGEPLLVAYDFKHDLARLQKVLGKDVPIMGNGNNSRKDMDLERAWNRGELPVMLANPQSVGHGVNLQEKCRHVCWHSLTYDYEVYSQFNDRVARQGNPYDRVTVHHIVARHTVDKDVLVVLAAKEGTERRLFEALRVRLKASKGVQ